MKPEHAGGWCSREGKLIGRVVDRMLKVSFPLLKVLGNPTGEAHAVASSFFTLIESRSARRSNASGTSSGRDMVTPMVAVTKSGFAFSVMGCSRCACEFAARYASQKPRRNR